MVRTTSDWEDRLDTRNQHLMNTSISTPIAPAAGLSMNNLTTQTDYKQNLIHKHTSKAGLRGKLDAKCIECIYDPVSLGSWRLQVDKCSSRGCPLHPVRATSKHQ